MELVKVCNKSEIREGTGKNFSVNGRMIAIFNVNGSFYAIDNTCTHQGGSLGDGHLEGSIVSCPRHGWDFDVITGISPTFGVNVDKYKLEIKGEDIFVDF